MQNETFRKIVSTKEYTLPATEQYPASDRILKNSNSLLIEGHNFYYPYAIGVKTGFTTQSKNCLIAASSKDGLELISIVLHAESTEDGRSARYLDTINLLEYGNQEYHSYSVLEEGQTVDTINISDSNGKLHTLDLIAKNKISIAVKNSEEPAVSSPVIKISENITVPVSKGTILGTVQYTIDGEIYTSDLLAASDIVESTSETASETSSFHFMPILYILLSLLLLRVFIFFLKKHVLIYRKKKSKKQARRYLKP